MRSLGVRRTYNVASTTGPTISTCVSIFLGYICNLCNWQRFALGRMKIQSTDDYL